MRCALLLIALFPAPALAQVSAEDVWAATEAYWEAFGLDLAGTPSRAGAVVTVSGIDAEGVLPMGFGTVGASAPDLVLTERGDGTVLVETANPATFAVRARLARGFGPDDGPMTAEGSVAVAWGGREMIASGTAGAVTFRLASGRVDLTLGELSLPEGVPLPLLEARLALASVRIETTVRTDGAGGLVLIDSDSAYGESVAAYGLAAADGTGQRTTSWAAGSTGTTHLALPAGGLALAGLAAALRAGASIEMAIVGGATESLGVTTAGGGILSEDSRSSGEGTATLRIDRGGALMRGALRDLVIRNTSEALGLPLAAAIDEVTYEVGLPLLGGAPGRAVYAAAARGIVPSPEAWDLADPAGVLPRGPLTLALGLDGTVTLPFDLLDPAAWAGIEGATGWPEGLDLGPLDLSAEARGAGLALTGEGRFDFDEDDLATYQGAPRPEGSARIEVEGLQGALDAAVRLGLATPEQASAARFALGAVLRAEGPDRSSAEVVLGPGADLTVNGQRLR